MTISQTTLIISEHMVVENNKYGKRQLQNDPPSLRLDPRLLPSARAELHLITSFNLDHFDSASLFTTLHLGTATTCAAVAFPTAEQQGRAKSRGGIRTSCIHSIPAVSDGEGGRLVPEVAQRALVFAFDDALFITCRQRRHNLQVMPV